MSHDTVSLPFALHNHLCMGFNIFGAFFSMFWLSSFLSSFSFSISHVPTQQWSQTSMARDFFDMAILTAGLMHASNYLPIPGGGLWVSKSPFASVSFLNRWADFGKGSFWVWVRHLSVSNPVEFWHHTPSGLLPYLASFSVSNVGVGSSEQEPRSSACT